MLREEQAIVLLKDAFERSVARTSCIGLEASARPIHGHAFDPQGHVANAAVGFQPSRPAISLGAEPVHDVNRPRGRRCRLLMKVTEHFQKRHGIAPARKRHHPLLRGSIRQRRCKALLQARYRVHGLQRQPATRS